MTGDNGPDGKIWSYFQFTPPAVGERAEKHQALKMALHGILHTDVTSRKVIHGHAVRPANAFTWNRRRQKCAELLDEGRLSAAAWHLFYLGVPAERLNALAVLMLD